MKGENDMSYQRMSSSILSAAVWLIALITQPVELYAASQLTAPSNTNAVAVSESRIDVYWKDNSTNEAGFEIYRSADGPSGLFTLVANAAAGVTALGNSALNPSTQYCYKVRALTKSGGRTRYSDFSKPACATTLTPPEQPGSIHISTATSGFDLDVNGYLLALDQVAGQAIGTSAAVTLTGVASGPHTLTLYGVASNCSVEGANPRTVSVAGGATTEVAFAVTCGSGPTIQLNTVTTGVNLDADGYGVMLWMRITGGRMLAASASVPANGNVRFFGLTTGEYDLEVNGIAANCMQINSLPPVDLTSGSTASLALNVSCAPVAGGVEICDNGLDDDGDGLADSLDPDCQLVCQYGDCMANTCGPGYICGFDGCCAPHCFDGQQTGDEGDVDCGGSCAAKCGRGQHCYGFWDCASGVCVNSICQ
jgi:hypothetical protein